MLRYLFLALALSLFATKPADAHFFGTTQEIDGYQMIFSPYPSSPRIGEDMTLNFSVLQNGANLFNIYAAVKVKDGSSGEVIFQEPYKQYEISDITVPFTFAEQGDYTVILETRILGDEKYQAQPLTVTFPISVFPPGIPLDELLLYYVTPAALVVAGIGAYLYLRDARRSG